MSHTIKYSTLRFLIMKEEKNMFCKAQLIYQSGKFPFLSLQVNFAFLLPWNVIYR